jgi:hypothetical protein
MDWGGVRSKTYLAALRQEWHLLHLHSIQNMVANLCKHVQLLIVPFDPCLLISIDVDVILYLCLIMKAMVSVAFICINRRLLFIVHVIFKLINVIYYFVLLLSFRANIVCFSVVKALMQEKIYALPCVLAML